jgi:hypothetical protein
MKLKVNSIGGAATSDDGQLSLGFKSGERTYTLQLSPQAQEQLTLALLASTAADPAGVAGRRIRPKGLGRFQLDNDVGISLLMNPMVAVHVVLARPLAEALLNLLSTFDDPSTWDLKGPNRH